MVNSSPGVEHLGIKPYNWWSEALHGVARSGLATVYPITMGMASSFDEEAVKEVYATVSDEARAKYHEAHRHGRFGQMNEGLTFWTPNVNIFRDPRWGRGQETWGEDPWLTARMGVAVVEGLQGPRDAKYDKLHACAKHYAVHRCRSWNHAMPFCRRGIRGRPAGLPWRTCFSAITTPAGNCR